MVTPDQLRQAEAFLNGRARRLEAAELPHVPGLEGLTVDAITRLPGFPLPIVQSLSGRVWDRRHVRAWLRRQVTKGRASATR